MANADFSCDEFLFLFIAGGTTLLGTLCWYRPLVLHRSLRTDRARALLILTPPACLAAVYFVLQRWGDPLYVAGHIDYVILFLLGGCAWLTVVVALLPLFGISPRDDAIDRRNVAATVFTCCTLLGVTAVYAGANVGGGPTIWTTLVPAFAGTLIFLYSLLLLSIASPLSDTIAIDRDLAAAIRNGGVLISIGLILGRAAAGDWTSWPSTFSDLFRLSCPLLILLPVAAVLNYRLIPTPARPTTSPLRAGLLPAAIFISLAVLYLTLLGPADIGRHVITYEQYTNSR